MFTYFLYNSILILVIIFSFLSEYLAKKVHRLTCRLIVFFSLFLPAALRYGVGADYYSYVRIFNDTTQTFNVEKSWIVLQNCIKNLGGSVEYLFAVAAFLIYFPLCFALPRKNFSLFMPFYILYGMYFQSFTILRQMIATSFMIWSFISFEKNKYLKSIFLFCIAFLFHKSMLFALLLLFAVRFIRIRGKKLPFVLVSVIIILFLKLDILSIALKVLSAIGSKYAVYINYSITKGMTHTGLGVIVKNFICFIPIVFYHRFCQLAPKKYYFANMSIAFVLLSFLTAQYFMFSRVLYAVYFFQLFPIGYSLLCIKKIRKPFLLAIYVTSILLFEVNIYRGNRTIYQSLDIYPYSSVFYKKDIEVIR